MDVNSQKCMGCGATLKYSPATQNFKCEYCNHEYTIEDIEKFQQQSQLNSETNKENIDINDGKVSDKEYASYTCKNCGAELITDDNTVATSCVYCRSTAIINNRIKGVLLPNKLIPFTKTKQDAIDAFKSCTKGKLFAPNSFNDPKNINEITGVYVPFWLYDSTVETEFKANGTKITSWTSGDYHYTKTDIYNVERDVSMDFEKVPADSSSKFEDNLMDSIEPYNYEELKDFNEAYLSGFLAEKYDVTKEVASKRMEERVANSAIERCRHSANSYSALTPTQQNVKITKGNISYVMLPVWMLNIKYGGKLYHFAMNGTTGKFIGEIPKDKHKARLYTFLFGLAFFVVGSLIAIIV